MGGYAGTVEERFWRYVQKGAGCWEWTACKSEGRGYMSSGTGSTLRPSRVSWTIHNGPIPAGLHVCHKCDNPGCVRPDHLFLGTPKDNMQDMVRKGRKPTKLTAEQVLRIRAAWPARSKSALAKEYGVTKSAISHVVKRRGWRHI